MTGVTRSRGTRTRASVNCPTSNRPFGAIRVGHWNLRISTPRTPGVLRLLRAALGRITMSRSRTRRAGSSRRFAAAVTAGTIVLGTALSALGADVATASSHREAPLISADPAVDNTDLYAFVSPDDPDTVTFV